MAMSIEMRRRIETNQRAEYANAFHRLQSDLEAVEIGSVDMFVLLNQANKEHQLHQGNSKLVKRFDNLTTRIANANNRDDVKVIFQFSN